MGVIQERTDSEGHTRYTAIIRLKGHPTECATFDRKTDAKIWIQQTESAIREGRYFKTAEAKKHTVDDLIERFKREVAPHRNDREKLNVYLDWWKKHIGKYLLSDITAARLVECRDKLLNEPSMRNNKVNDTKKSPATVNRYLAAISVVFTAAVKDWGWMEDNPMSKVRKPKEPRGRVRFLSDEEREALLKACKESRNSQLYTIVVIALSTGARMNEILGLTWKDIDFKKRRIRLEDTKNGERRSIHLSEHSFCLIEELSKIRPINTPYVFPSLDGSKPMDIRDAWNKAVERANLEDFRFHDLRHTAASYLAMNGATLVEIAEILGHKTLDMVKKYAHLTDQHTAKLLERMNRKQFGK